jgi:hypothetical protein
MDAATVLPVNTKHNSFFGKVPPKIAQSIIRQYIATGNKRPHNADPQALNITDLYTRWIGHTGADADVRQFQLEFYDIIENHPDVHTFFIDANGASTMYVMCLAGLLSVYAGQQRFVRSMPFPAMGNGMEPIELVDPSYQRMVGWSKSRVWLVYTERLDREKQHEGLSALMVLGLAKQHQQLASTFDAVAQPNPVQHLYSSPPLHGTPKESAINEPLLAELRKHQQALDDEKRRKLAQAAETRANPERAPGVPDARARTDFMKRITQDH